MEEPKKQSFQNSRTNTYMNSQKLRQHVQTLRGSAPDRLPVLRKDTGPHSYARSYAQLTKTHEWIKTQSSQIKSHWIYKTLLSASPMPSIKCIYLVYFVLWLFLLFISSCFSLFVLPYFILLDYYSLDAFLIS